MKQLKPILMAILAAFGWLFAPPASSARRGDDKRGGFNFLPALCALFFSAIIGDAAFAEPDGVFTVTAWPPLHQAAADGNITEVNRLIDGGADINAKAKHGHTPLHLAFGFETGDNYTKIADVLIKAGADIHAKDNHGDTPLHAAAIWGHTESTDALIKAGADINAKNNRGKTPLHYVAGAGETKTMFALIKAGADIDAKSNHGWTPLHEAALDSEIETAQILIKAGAQIEAKTNDGQTPLHLAITPTHLAVNKSMAAGKTLGHQGPTRVNLALVAKSQNRMRLAVVAIVKAGADLFARTNEGKTPLDIAIEKHGKDSVIALFLEGAMKKSSKTNQQQADELLRKLD